MKETFDEFGRQMLIMEDRSTEYQKVFTCQILVVDLDSASIVARHDGETMFAGFIGQQGLIFAREFMQDGTMRVGIWDVDLGLARM
jgi:hypothetical protein